MKTRTTIVALSSIMAVSSLASAATWHVKPTAAGSGLGNNWSNAATLAYALANAASGDSIWVAAGTYKPANQSSSFELVDGVRVLGGFVGNETVESQRNPNAATNGCILSGDLSNNDGANFANYGDNCIHVVVGLSLDDTAELDGFTIRGGSAIIGSEPEGGGIMIVDGQDGPRILGCRIIENQGDISGGAIKIKGGSTGVEIRGCNISNNRTIGATSDGGAISFKFSSGADVVNCRLANNTSVLGGAIAHSGDAIVNVFNCVIQDNVADEGGGVYFSGSSGGLLRLVNTLVAQNQADLGGGIAILIQIPVEIRDCTIADNSAATSGGGVYVDSSAATTIANSILWGNSAPSNAQIAVNSHPVTVDRSDVQGGWSGSGANNLNSNPVFVNTSADNYRLGCASPCIDAGDNNFIANDDADLDLDGTTGGEDVPYDLDMRARVVNTTVDMGAYENTINLACPGNIATAGSSATSVDIDDLLLLISLWGPCPAGPAACAGDIDSASGCGGDGVVDIDDLLALLALWGECGGTPDAFPGGLNDCFNVYCAGLSGAEWQECLTKCFEAFCEARPTECD